MCVLINFYKTDFRDGVSLLTKLDRKCGDEFTQPATVEYYYPSFGVGGHLTNVSQQF